jgi:beta-1,4-mannosyl-glycoprotein beta-1,4-N-acetylglucosaminyltransferase
MKVIDCFIFYNELDMLEFRLNELNDIVDYFVLVECIKTFANNDKELYFENNKARFSKFLDKIIHIIVKDNIPQPSSMFDIEDYQRYCIDEGIRKLSLNSDDLIIIADLDEIPDSKTVLNLKNDNAINDIYSLEMDLYYYNITCIYNKKWSQPKILNYGTYVKYNNPKIILREVPNVPIIKNGGWHLSYFGNVDFIKNKIRTFSHHKEWDNDFILNDDRIKKQIQNSSDLYEQSSVIFSYIDINNNSYLPHKYEEFKDFLNKYNYKCE